MHQHLREILAEKGGEVFSVAPAATVAEAVDKMNEKGVGAVLVIDEGVPVGMFTERDVLKRVVAARRHPDETHVADVMSKELVAVRQDLSVEDAMAVVSQRRCRHLPVVEEGKVIGLVSSGDLTHCVSRNREVQIKQLVDFITGKYPA